MWRAVFKRERVYLLFQATSITGRLFPSPRPPLQPSALQGGLSPGGSAGTGAPPSRAAGARRPRLRQSEKRQKRELQSRCAERNTVTAVGWRGALSLLPGTRTRSVGGRQLCPHSGPRAPRREEELSRGVIALEAPGWSPDHHRAEDNEVTVLPLPHKALIAVSFQNRLWS